MVGNDDFPFPPLPFFWGFCQFLVFAYFQEEIQAKNSIQSRMKQWGSTRKKSRKKLNKGKQKGNGKFSNFSTKRPKSICNNQKKRTKNNNNNRWYFRSILRNRLCLVEDLTLILQCNKMKTMRATKAQFPDGRGEFSGVIHENEW